MNPRKFALKNPILIIGLILMFIFLNDLKKRGMLPDIFQSRTEKLKPVSCKSSLVMLEKRMDTNWKVACDDNNLVVIINSPLKRAEFPKEENFNAAVYRELANHIIFVSRNSLNESLERTFTVRMHLQADDLKLNALTKGEDIAQFANMKNPKFIREHFQKTVFVEEVK